MAKHHLVSAAIALAALAFCNASANAGTGPCVPAIDFGLMCGSGDGAARAIVKTISPSRRLAFAWRLANRQPTSRPEDNDPNLENLVIRIEDGAVLAKSHGAYWDLSTKIAKAYLMTAWSPDSHLLVKVEQRAESASAELFSFADSDQVIGPFDLVNVIKPAVAKMENIKGAQNVTLVFAAHPAISVDDHGLIHATVSIRMQDATDGRPYDAAVQVTRAAGSTNAKVVSVTPFDGTTISIIVH